MAIADGTMEKRDCLPSLLEQKHISLFYCNSRKAILNPHQHRSKTTVLPKVFGEAFFKKLRYSLSAKQKNREFFLEIIYKSVIFTQK